MGYYDQDYENKNRKQKGNRGGWLISAMMGAILGGLLIVFSMPALIKWDIIPYDLEQATPSIEEVMEEEEQEEATTDEVVSISVVTDVTKAVEVVSDAVVGVINIQETGFWSERDQAGTGSGVIYKKDDGNAFIVTNHHVIEGATEVEVSLNNGERVPAKVLGSDVYTDLAVLRIDAEQVTQIAELGTSENLKPGEPVIAIGNPLGLQFSGSVTQGIISGLNRTIEIDLNNDGRPDWHAEVIQTDAAINPGNSGGALVNIRGQVIGINSMKIARDAVEGIGLSIPMEIVKPTIADLEMYGEVRRPFMGIGLRSVNEIPTYHWNQTLKLPPQIDSGVFLVSVMPMSPADQAGLQELDVIVALDNQPIHNVIELRKYLFTKKEIGETLEITFYREGEKMTTQMRLAEENTF